jgi:hypothetical protein
MTHLSTDDVEADGTAGIPRSFVAVRSFTVILEQTKERFRERVDIGIAVRVYLADDAPSDLVSGSGLLWVCHATASFSTGSHQS